MANRLAKRKLKCILDTGARIAVTANAGCILQIAAEARRQGQTLGVAHPMELLDLSYQGKPVPN
jgi:glycolate oxidase iron-sulfur subunit